jgi:hypothetical protein
MAPLPSQKDLTPPELAVLDRFTAILDGDADDISKLLALRDLPIAEYPRVGAVIIRENPPKFIPLMQHLTELFRSGGLRDDA